MILEPPVRRFECPSCGRQETSRQTGAVTIGHACPKVAGLSVPYVEVMGSELRKHSVRHVVVERGDWIGDERGVMRDIEGRAVMAVHTERADGSHDTQVFAPSATGTHT